MAWPSGPLPHLVATTEAVLGSCVVGGESCQDRKFYCTPLRDYTPGCCPLLPGAFKPVHAGYCERTDMADTLRRLTNTSPFSVLQDKLESWHKDYHVSYLVSNERPESD